jgi:hypothetical protein
LRANTIKRMFLKNLNNTFKTNVNTVWQSCTAGHTEIVKK